MRSTGIAMNQGHYAHASTRHAQECWRCPMVMRSLSEGQLARRSYPLEARNAQTYMYTIIFGQRSHHISDDAAGVVENAIIEGARVVTIQIDLGGEGVPFDVTLNVANVVALIRHREPKSIDVEPSVAEPFRPRLVVG
jgi:hypothetical protein